MEASRLRIQLRRGKEGFIMRTVKLEELLEAGCHFGHQVSRQNPKAREFIFETRDNIHIIDLEKTKEGLEEAGKFVHDLAKKGGTILVVGTKRQAEGILREEFLRSEGKYSEGLFFVTKRWIGGTLTNFSEVAKNFKKLKDISYQLQDENQKAIYTKKEISGWEKSRVKLESFYGGIAEMNKAPDALFIIDTHLERVAAEEALKIGTTTVGITDTNADPMIIGYPIPANDDAVGSLKLIINYIFDAWIEGKKAGEKEAASNAAAEAEAAAKEEKKQKQEEDKKESGSKSKELKVEKESESKTEKGTKKPAAKAPKKEAKKKEAKKSK